MGARLKRVPSIGKGCSWVPIHHPDEVQVSVVSWVNIYQVHIFIQSI